MAVPTPDAIRRALMPLDARQHKIVGGVIAVMLQNSERVRDREWITEQLTHVTVLAGEFDVSGGPDAVQEVQRYVAENIDTILNVCYQLFLRVGKDLEPRAEAGVTYEEAMAQAMSYF